jgi:hypothetical protein
VLIVIAVAALAASGATASTTPTQSFVTCVSRIAGMEPDAARHGSIVYAWRSRPLDPNTHSEIRVTTATGARPKTLLRSDSWVSSPSVSPDGRLIAFDRWPRDEVWIMNRDGSDAHFVMTGRSPRFSPDGRQLAIGGAETGFDRFDLDLVNLDGSNRSTLVADAGRYPQASWSPGGKRIAFVGITREQLDFPNITRVNADGSGEAVVRIFGEEPRWSPNGRWIAYTDNGDRAAPTEIHLVTPSGTPDRTDRVLVRMKNRDAYGATWSPDGRHLVFATRRAGGEGTGAFADLWSVEPTGRGLHPLSSTCRFGTGERDRVHGTAHADTIFALEGSDRIDVRGGGRDIVGCGPGYDTVIADRRDRIARNCERVVRS